MEMMSPARASATFRLARSCAPASRRRRGPARAVLEELHQHNPQQCAKNDYQRQRNHVAIAGYGLGLSPALAAAPSRSRQFLGDIGRRTAWRRGNLALALQGRQFGIDAVAAKLGELRFQIVVFAGGGELVEGLGGGLFLGDGLLRSG